MKIRYNAPVTLTFCLVCLIMQLIAELVGQQFAVFFSSPGIFDVNPVHYIGFVTHSFAHSGFPHLIGNLSFILLLGPILEERYGVVQVAVFMGITTVSTGLLNALFFDVNIYGASGLVFLFIILSSFVNVKKGEIPLTFVFVALLFIGKEIYDGLKEDQISQSSHIIGGIIGGIIGFFWSGKKKSGQELEVKI